MAKDFSFPFYVNNWIGGVVYYNFEQRGAYLELLLLQFNHGKFTETQVKQVLNTSYSNVWETINEKFKTDGTFFWNERMEQVKEERKAFVESRRNNRLGKTKDVTSVKLKKNTRKTLVKLVEGESKDNNIELNKKVFDVFRKLFPGTKKGNETEFDNFINKTEDWKEILPTLEGIIKNQISIRASKKNAGEFVPEWKMLSTWINQRCWEEEMAFTIKQAIATSTFKKHPGTNK